MIKQGIYHKKFSCVISKATRVNTKNVKEPNNKLKFLLLSEDKYPPFRNDVKILFGKEIAGRGHQVDWILQSNDDCERSYKTTWHGCCVWVGRTNNGTSRFSRLKSKFIQFSLLLTADKSQKLLDWH